MSNKKTINNTTTKIKNNKFEYYSSDDDFERDIKDNDINQQKNINSNNINILNDHNCSNEIGTFKEKELKNYTNKSKDELIIEINNSLSKFNELEFKYLNLMESIKK